MYESFYGFEVPPFHNTPNARLFFESEQHREALAQLEYVVRNRRGFSLITGAIGCGKTTLTRALIGKMGSQIRTATVNNTRVGAQQLLKMICAELRVELPPNADKAEVLTCIRRFAEQQNHLDRTVVVIIDEGQCLSVDCFEELRLLTNLESETEKLVQLLILGQPELRALLKHPRLAPLTQRIVMMSHLQPLSFDEMIRYIAFRLVRASASKPNVDFSKAALRAIYVRSRGVPRVVNLVCDNALLVAYARQSRFIDTAIVHRAINNLLPDFQPQMLDSDTPTMGRTLPDLAAPGPLQEAADAEASAPADPIVIEAKSVPSNLEVSHG